MKFAIISADPIRDGYVHGGFAHRHWSVVNRLVSDGHEVRLVLIDRGDFSNVKIDVQLAGAANLDIRTVAGPAKRSGASGQARRFMRNLIRPSIRARSALSRKIEHQIGGWAAEIAILLTPFNPELVYGLTVDCPVVLFAEEDFSRSWDSAASANCITRWIGRVERAAQERAWPKADAVVVISDRERPWAESLFPKADVRVMPLFLDENRWFNTTIHHEPLDILAVGNFNDLRNAAGMAQFVGAMRASRSDDVPRVAIVSRNPPHPMLSATLGEFVAWLGDVEDVTPLYRAATLCLVPAKAVSGAKNQVLQGWYTGCPVVASEESAASVGATNGVELLTGETPTGLLGAVHRLLIDGHLRHQLQRRGRERYDQFHHRDTVLSEFVRWVTSVEMVSR